MGGLGASAMAKEYAELEVGDTDEKTEEQVSSEPVGAAVTRSWVAGVRPVAKKNDTCGAKTLIMHERTNVGVEKTQNKIQGYQYIRM